MYVASRLRIVSRIPPASPAAIMFVKSGSKVFGNRPIESAVRSPLTVSPARVRPEYANVAIGTCLSKNQPSRTDRRASRPLSTTDRPRGGAASESRARHDADPAIDHVLQLVFQRRRRQRGLERDQPLQVQTRQRL